MGIVKVAWSGVLARWVVLAWQSARGCASDPHTQCSALRSGEVRGNLACRSSCSGMVSGLPEEDSVGASAPRPNRRDGGRITRWGGSQRSRSCRWFTGDGLQFQVRARRVAAPRQATCQVIQSARTEGVISGYGPPRFRDRTMSSEWPGFRPISGAASSAVPVSMKQVGQTR